MPLSTKTLSSSNRLLLAPFALSDPSESPRARPLALGLTLGLAPSPGARGVLMTRRVFAASVFAESAFAASDRQFIDVDIDRGG